jgi:hypothetical protein
VSEHAQLGFVAQGKRQQPAVAGPLQNLHRLPAGLLGTGAIACQPGHPRQPPQAGAELAQVPQRAVQVNRTPPGFDRLVERADRVALDRVLCEQPGPLTGGEPVGVVEDKAEVGGGLAVRASAGRLSCGGRAIPNYGVHVPRLCRVMDDLRRVRLVPVNQGGEHALVQCHQPRRRQRARYGAPGEFMPERDSVGGHGQQAALLGRRQCRRPAGAAARHERINQPAIECRRDDGQLLEHILNKGIQMPDPRQYGIHDRARNALALRRDKQLLDEEWIA